VTTANPAAQTTAPLAVSTAADATTTTEADDDGEIANAHDEDALPAVPLPTKPPVAADLRLQYQRVGRDLLKLQDQRGRFDCGGMMPRFKAIKLDTALATPAGRMELAVLLAQLSLKIDRMKGIKLDAECLQNPLAPSCM
jgi:hypothetical protein